MNTTLPDIRPLILDHAGNLPFTMALPLSKALESYGEGRYRDTMIHILDFFEMSVQWVNCYWIALLSLRPGCGNLKGLVRAVNMIDTKRPLSFGDCVNELFNPLLDAAQKSIPDHPLLLSLSEHVKTRRHNILTGSEKEPGVIKIRNDFKGHSTSLAGEIYLDVVHRLMPSLRHMLLGLEPLTRARAYAFDPDGNEIDVKGTAIVRSASSGFGHYFVEFDGECVDLFPLITLKDGHAVFVFQTLRDEAVKYESSDENVYGFTTEALNPDFDIMMQRVVPTFDIAKEANWGELCMAMRRHSSAYMVQVQKEKKYNSELFVDRRHLTGLLDKFTRSDTTLFPLPGDAGQGKTNQICHWTEKFLSSDIPVLVFAGSEFADSSLADKIRYIFNVSTRRSVSRVLDRLHEQCEANHTHVFFFFDAVNECLHYPLHHTGIAAASLFADILSLLVSDAYPCFKILATCRSYTWKNQILPLVTLPQALTFTDSSDREIAVCGFSARETEEAYRIYGDLYQMTTPFENLDRRVMLRLRDPLILKFVCSNYVGKSLSDIPLHYTSISLFDRMIDDITVSSFAGRRQRELLDNLGHLFLDSYINGEPVSSVSNMELIEALDDPASRLHPLARLIYKDGGLTVAYTELRNKPDRPILRETEKIVNGRSIRSIEFIYERFTEYIMARAFISDCLKRYPDGNIPSREFVKAFSRAAVNVVFIGAMRNALLMAVTSSGRFDTVIDLITSHHTDTALMQVVNETIDVIIRENYESEIFALQSLLLSAAPDDPTLITRLGEVKKAIADDRATADTIATHNHLSAQLAPVMRLRNTASIAIKNILLTDYFNEQLYRSDPLEFLWRLVSDPLTDVSDEACKLIYYLSKRHHTHSGTPISDNLTARIVTEMYDTIKSRTIMGNVTDSTRRRRAVKFVETATRLATILIIDATMAPVQDTAMIRRMLDEIRGIARYFTWRFRIVHIMMPFLQTVMRKQITFQSIYVNNAVEYQGFWNDSIVAPTGPDNKWTRARLADAMSFVSFYHRHHTDFSTAGCLAEKERFRNFIPVIESAYASGCSFSYFIIERLMVVMGVSDWNLVADMIRRLLHDSDFEWYDYRQMSLLYTLFQIEVNSPSANEDILDIYTREAYEWTKRCRGYFKARYSHKANPTGLYKRNVINWYCVVYCAHSGDGIPRNGDTHPAPLLYRMIDEAIDTNDKELLFHLLDNISELISDFGYIDTALGALKYILTRYDSTEKVDALDAVSIAGPDPSDDGLVRTIGKVLATAKIYFPDRTDAFLKSDIAGLAFPGVTLYRDEILNYHTGGESLSDLFTHRFGNFLMWSLLNEKVVDDFAIDAICIASDSDDCFQWFDGVIRILFSRLFNVKL